MITVKVLGVPQLLAKLAIMPVLADVAGRAGLMAGADRIKAAAEQGAPRLTGAMAESIKATDEEVTVSVPYAPFVELGTQHMLAQPFLEPAFEQQEGEVVGLTAAAVRLSLYRL